MMPSVHVIHSAATFTFTIFIPNFNNCGFLNCVACSRHALAHAFWLLNLAVFLHFFWQLAQVILFVLWLISIIINTLLG
jgi:hypothetical protein